MLSKADRYHTAATIILDVIAAEAKAQKETKDYAEGSYKEVLRDLKGHLNSVLETL